MTGFPKGFPRILLICLFLFSLVLAAQTDSTALQEKYSREGQQALSQGRLREAQQAYEHLRALAPRMAEVHAQLGMIYFQEKKFDLAEQSLHRALQLKPSLPGLHTMLALSLAELGHYRQALPGLERGFHGSTPPAVKRMCGLELERAYTQLQQNANAVEVALELNRLYPNDPEVLYHAGRIFGNFAFLAMHRLATVAPKSLWRHEAEAEVFQSQGSYDLAIREYRTVLSLNPAQPNVHYLLGRTYLARSRQTNSAKDEAAAMAEFQAELKLNPSHASAAYEIAEMERNAGHLTEAKTYFEQALKYYPDFEEAHLGLAAVRLAQRQPRLAIPELRKAIALNRDNDVAWYRLAQAYRELGNLAEQRQAFTEFQRLRQQQASRQANPMSSPDAVTPQKVAGGQE